MTLPRVVAVGFNRVATRSLCRFFESAGHTAVHHKERKRFRPARNIARLMEENLAKGRKVFDGVDGYTFYADLIYLTPEHVYEGNSAFREMLRDYPDTILLLNTRDREGWIGSRLRHGHGEVANRYLSATGLPDMEALTDKWRADWDAHHAAVRAFMADKPAQFVEFDIEKDSPEKLAAALPDYRLDPATWGQTGKSKGRTQTGLYAAIARGWSHLRPRRHR